MLFPSSRQSLLITYTQGWGESLARAIDSTLARTRAQTRTHTCSDPLRSQVQRCTCNHTRARPRGVLPSHYTSRPLEAQDSSPCHLEASLEADTCCCRCAASSIVHCQRRDRYSVANRIEVSRRCWGAVSALTEAASHPPTAGNFSRAATPYHRPSVVRR